MNSKKIQHRFFNTPVIPLVGLPFILIALVALMLGSSPLVSAKESDAPTSTLEKNVAHMLVDLLKGEGEEPEAILDWVDENWKASMLPMLLESYGFAASPEHRLKMLAILSKNTGQGFGADTDAWFRWWWSLPEQRHPNYAEFKSLLYRNLDPKFEGYFDVERNTTIRLDEVRWGGVAQDGIPPLRGPNMIEADSATYLADSDVVFGVEFEGDARAYPKRILAWHEMFIDTIGGTEYAGVYCTLCGAVIMYKTVLDGKRYELGTSGFLYRSNKLMFDQATQSLWNTTYGEPVIGPLTSDNVRLQRSYLVTSTWGEWKRRHPDTQVLSLNTGYQRNYDEGAAYKNYFSTDSLMFSVPKLDDRLANKDEVLALTFPSKSKEVLAVSADFLSKNPIYHDSLGSQKFVVLTDPSGANRVFAADGDLTFEQYDGDINVTDNNGVNWRMTEAGLQSPEGEVALRLPAHRAFWFGWYASHNDTRLVM